MSDSFCVSCGTRNPAAARYCAKCGISQSETPVVTEDAWRCQTCGTSYDAAVTYCVHCRQATLTKKAAHPANNATFGWLLICGILTFLAVPVGDVFLGLPAWVAITGGVAFFIAGLMQISANKKKREARTTRPN